jgi:adenosylhomocysteine nucleosidase
MPKRIAIIVAMKMEIAPLLREWKRQGKQVEPIAGSDRRGASAEGYRCENTVVYCGGIGPLAARRAAERAISERPELLVSAGLAGALNPKLKVGDVLRPAVVIDAATTAPGEVRNPEGGGVLVSTLKVASPGQKQELARMFQADAVDMEAAAVAEVAGRAGIPFMAIKAVSDTSDFQMPPFDRFISAEGKLNLLHLTGWAVLRPRTWRGLVDLQRNSRKAAEELARELQRVLVKCDQKN